MSSYKEMWKSTHHFVSLNNQISFKTSSGLIKLCIQYIKTYFHWLSDFKCTKNQISILISETDLRLCTFKFRSRVAGSFISGFCWPEWPHEWKNVLRHSLKSFWDRRDVWYENSRGVGGRAGAEKVQGWEQVRVVSCLDVLQYMQSLPRLGEAAWKCAARNLYNTACFYGLN